MIAKQGVDLSVGIEAFPPSIGVDVSTSLFQNDEGVIAVPDGDRLVVIASNWGQRQHPAWYHNLCAHREATLTVGGVSRRVQAHEAVGEERVRLWQQDLEVYPGRTAYARRAAYRPIPVVVLAPVPDQPG